MSNRLEQALQRAVEEQKIPCAVVYATNADGSFAFKHTVGSTTLDGNNPATEDTEFLLASSTKLLTTIAILHIVEKGLVTLDEDVTPHLPELAEQPILKGFDDADKPILEERKGKITLRHLLTHSSGVGLVQFPEIAKWKEQHGMPENSPKIVDGFSLPLRFEPSQGWIYGVGLDWAGLLLQRLTGQSLEEYEQEHFWRPLNATSLTFWPRSNPSLKSKLFSLAIRTEDGKLAPFENEAIDGNPEDCFGGHGMFGSMGDYVKVLQSLLANDGKLLRPETVDMMFQPQLSEESAKALQVVRESDFGKMLIGDNPTEYKADFGLGGMLFLEDHDGRRKKGSLSWGGAVNTFWVIDREADLALTFGTQLFPPGEEVVSNVIKEVELALYEMRGVKF